MEATFSKTQQLHYTVQYPHDSCYQSLTLPATNTYISTSLIPSSTESSSITGVYWSVTADFNKND